MLSAVGDDDLLGSDLVVRVAGRLVDDRFLELGQAASRRVAVIAGVAAGGDSGGNDGRRGWKVGLSGPEADHVDSLGLQLLCLGVDGQGR